ncbi:MAG TPA: FlgD immunoglobulin-like domain containing protein [Candidatus Binatia bacterium]|nr:FlgD immunoglobulin-like domain containing protein [Candidatus Binatia bacterium]
MARPFRSSRIPDLLILVGCLLVLPPGRASGSSEIIATRLLPSSVSARYGPAVALSLQAPGGSYVVPSRTGVEFRTSGALSDTLDGSFRTAGDVEEVAMSGRTAYLFAGDRGIVAVDTGDSTNLVAIGGHDHLGVVRHGAFAPSSNTLAAASDLVLYFLREDSPGSLHLIDTRAYTDGRKILRIQARADSFLVLSLRFAPTLRMLVTLYRVRSGTSAAESLWEFQANGLQAQDLCWPDAMAFVAVGNDGILPIDTETRLAAPAALVQGGRFVRHVDADGSSVVAVGESRTYAQFTRSGLKGRTLASQTDRLTSIDAFHVTLVGGLAVLSEDDQSPPPEPDEVANSLVEVLDVAQPLQPGRTQTTGQGRARRVVGDQGLAYLADYTGGLRIYRAGSADTSLVGVVPLAGNARAYDLAVDPVRHIVFLAAGTAGVLVVDVADPAAPGVVGSLLLPGITTTVSVINDTLAVAGRRGGSSAGVTFLGVANPSAPVARGALNYPSVMDPRALAVRDTVLFVADNTEGLLSVGFADPDAPVPVGAPSGMGASDLDLSGTSLVVGTSSDGVQIVDVTNPAAPNLLATVPSPPTFGVTQLGQTAIAALGNDGVLAIDLRIPSVPLVRGVIEIPGFSRDAFWANDSTLLVAATFGLERYRAGATVTVDPALSLSQDPSSLLPRVTILWFQTLPPGAIGWNLFRDPGGAAEGLATATGLRVNDSLLGPPVRAAVDDGAPAGATLRYRLEAFFPDGSSRKVAEGAITIGSNARVGRVYPNPYRPRNGLLLQIPYRVPSTDGGKSIRLRVFDSSGRLVRRIPGGTPPGGGFGSLAWDGRDDRGRLLADGVYFVRLQGPGIDDARQFILLR